MEPDNKTRRARYRTLWILMTSVVVLWAVSGYFLYGLGTNERGTFGDMFGAINALFSGLAFAGIIYTIFLQRKELELQRRELTETRGVLQGQKYQLERQAFENAFFQMLTLHNEIVGSFYYKSIVSGDGFRGKECFPAIKHDLRVFLKKESPGGPMENRYKDYYQKHAHVVLGHYFRNLYQIVKYVKNSDVTNKKFYTNIIRAQLSAEELFLLFWNTLSEFGKEKFLPLMLEFEFFEHLPQDGTIQSADAYRYGPKAFGQSIEWASYISREN